MPQDDKINRLAQRALELVNESLPEATKLQQLRWISQDDPDLLDAASAAALASDETLTHRGRAIELLARIRYGDTADRTEASDETQGPRAER